MIRNFFIFLFSLLILSCTIEIKAQAVPTMNIESLTDQQLLVLMNQYQLNGLSDMELEMKAREKGLNNEQINQLKKRIALIDPSTVRELNAAPKAPSDPYALREKVPVKTPSTNKIDSSKILKPFGASIFENNNLSFEPNINIATPQNYIIGVNDQLVIDVFGVSDITKRLVVTTEGDIRFPNLGPVKVAGLTIEEASVKLKKSLTKIYPGIANGSVKVQVSVGQIRSIRVTLIGEIKRPGNYDISSLSTLMNALYVSGGPNEIGSFRNIELVRNGKNISTFDLYDFLLKSDLTKNLLLQDGDVIRVNPYTNRITVKGAVKKPAIFDVKPNESAADMIQYAGGFADMAYKEIVRVFRFGAKNKELLSIKFPQLSSFKLNVGDTLVVDTLADMFTNRVTINGAVYYPGAYGMKEMKSSLRELLVAAKIKEDAYVNRALLRRLKYDFTTEYINFNINEVMNGSKYIELIREDSVQIYRINDLREKYYVTVNGEINKPGTFEYADGMTAQDLILLSGGFKEGASLQKIEISRRLKPDGSQKDSAVYSLIKEINLSSQNKNSEDFNFKLSPFDIVSIRRSPVYKEQITVTVEGEIVYPGKYTLAGNEERISDLIRRAGGLKQKGFAAGAVLIRRTYRDLSESDATLINTKTNLSNAQSGKSSTILASSDTSVINNLYKEQKPVGIQLDQILQKPGSSEDLFLLEGDILKVPKQLQTIQTFGAVNVPKQIVYFDGISFKDALRESGRYSINASRKNSYVIYPNGQVRKTKSFLFIRSYPEIRPGTEIYVSAKKPKAKLSTGEVIGIVTSLTSLVSILILLANTTK
ncbi:MAG: SLBB domain-containing protein [Sphingobacteriia bacterium]|jgi:protein involved in polysaccharide export with SLBB domain